MRGLWRAQMPLPGRSPAAARKERFATGETGDSAARRGALGWRFASVAPASGAASTGRHGRRPRNNEFMLSRRHLLAALAAAPAGAALAQAPKPSERGGPLRLGADRALVESGLARSLQHAFGADTGIAVLLVPGPALAVLDAVRDGEVDAALLNVPDAEQALDSQGLVHDRRLITPERVHPGRTGAAEAGARPPAAAGQERHRGARQDPRPGLCRPDQPGLPDRRRRLRSACRRAGALARGQDRAGRAVVRRRRSEAAVHRPGACQGRLCAGRARRLGGARRGAAGGRRRRRSAAGRVGARDALVSRQPSGRQDLPRLDRRRPRPRRGRRARRRAAALTACARWHDRAGC